MPFLPICREDLAQCGIEQLDFVYISGDAYVDHPSFGCAIITRVLEAKGFTVGVLAQPNWKDPQCFLELGVPKYAFLVSAGNLDSMVAHYTVAKQRRSKDAYSPGEKIGHRPDRAVTVYTQTLRSLCPDTPILIGGLEASLRRFAHYDYWSDSVRPSVLEESGADLLMYGMGEREILQIAQAFREGKTVEQMRSIRGTCYLVPPEETPFGCVECPGWEQIAGDKAAYAKATRIEMDNQDEITGRTLIQRQQHKMLVQNPPMEALTTQEMDWVYSLPYMRTNHPVYETQGGVPAIREVEFSITHNRGCFGACNFCSIAFHQGRKISVRSHESVLEEAKLLTKNPYFKGYIHDVGGPTANFRHPSCEKQRTQGLCKGGKKCLAPKPCPALLADQEDYRKLLEEVAAVPGVKKVFVRSGIRYDYLLQDKNDRFFRQLVERHISGQLKVAPEHCSNAVLNQMGKPNFEAYLKFQKQFYQITEKAGKKQYLIPYLMSSHPGSTLEDAIALAKFLRKENLHPEQVQDFYPTPGTVSTCMYYTGLNPYTMKPVFVPKTKEEKAMQRALLQYYRPENRELVRKALKLAGRTDLIGSGPDCLIPAEPKKQNPSSKPANQPHRGTVAWARQMEKQQKGKGRYGKKKK